MKSAMYIMAVIAMMMRTAGAWSVERRGGMTAFMRKKGAPNNNKKKNNKIMKSIAREEGASYQLRMTDTLDDPKRMKIEEMIKNKVGASHLKMVADTLDIKVAEESAAIEVESSTVGAIEENQQAKKSSALDVEIISRKRDSAGRPGTEEKKSSPSDESSSDRSKSCLLYTSPSPRDQRGSRMPSSA